VRNLYLFIGLALLLPGCASEPTEEINEAEAALSQAQQAEASQWAPEASLAAEERMKEARRLIEQGDYSEAVPVLAEATRLAEAAVEEAGEARRAAEEEQRRLEAEKKRAEEELAARRASHAVVKGECLWRIAADPDVYGDPYQWTKIYDANKDLISDPDLIYPEQVLKVPR
jgi:nucleoid-associated protein YgaU